MKKFLLILVLVISFTGLVKSQTTKVFIISPEKGHDAIVNSYEDSVNYGSVVLNQATAWTKNGYFFVNQSLLDFEIQSIPQNATIINAKLSLKFATIGFFGGIQYTPNECFLSRITEPWVEDSVTWLSRPAYTTVNEAMVDCSTTPYQDYDSIDVTQLVQDMVSDTLGSYGFILRLQNETTYRSFSIASGDHPDRTLRPKLTVVYNVPSGLNGINENEDKELKCSFMPNPANSQISVTADVSGEYLLKILSSDGRLVKEQRISLTQGGSKSINLEGIDAGLYIFSLSDDIKTSINKIMIY